MEVVNIASKIDHFWLLTQRNGTLRSDGSGSQMKVVEFYMPEMMAASIWFPAMIL